MKDFGIERSCLYAFLRPAYCRNDARSRFCTARICLCGWEFSGPNPWSEQMRQEIQRQLNIKAYDIYGLSEIIGPGVACGRVEQDGMHINEDHFYPEIIDPVTEEVLPEGEIRRARYYYLDQRRPASAALSH